MWYVYTVIHYAAALYFQLSVTASSCIIVYRCSSGPDTVTQARDLVHFEISNKPHRVAEKSKPQTFVHIVAIYVDRFLSDRT